MGKVKALLKSASVGVDVASVLAGLAVAKDGQEARKAFAKNIKRLKKHGLDIGNLEPMPNKKAGDAFTCVLG